MKRKLRGVLLTAALVVSSLSVGQAVWAEDGFADEETISQQEEGETEEGTEGFSDEKIEAEPEEFSAAPSEDVLTDGDRTDEGFNAKYALGEIRKLEIGKTYNILSDLQPEQSSYKRFTASVNCPAAGRIKFVINDCNVVQYLRGDEGIHSTSADTAETYWHTVNNETVKCEFQVVNLNYDSQNFNQEATLTVKFQSIDDYNGELAGNDSFDQATPMKLNTLYEGSSVGSDSGEDYYKFVLDKPGSVILNHSGAGSAKLYGETTTGNTYKIRYGISDKAVFRLAAGNYYIVSGGGSLGGEYTLKVDATYESADDFEQENNNVKSQANEKNVNHWYTGNLNDRQDVDCFKIDLTERSVVSVEFRVPRQIFAGIFKIALCDSSMNEISSATNTSDPYLTFGNEIYDPGTYYIRVTVGKTYYHDQYSAYDYSFNFNQTKYVPVSTISIPSSKDVKLGECVSLNAVVAPSDAYNKELKWSSSDSDVAEVTEEGQIKAKRTGTAIITAEATDDSGVSATCLVKVYTVKVSEIRMTETVKNVKPGDVFQLLAYIKPTDAYNKKILCKSSNPEVADVLDGGYVKAYKVGTAVITYTTTDGSNLSAQCVVNVDNVKVSKIVLSETNKNISSGEWGFTLKATVTPSDAYDKKLKWTSTNTNVAEVDQDGYVHIWESGTAVVTATAVDGSKVSASCAIRVTTNLAYQLNGGKNDSSNPTVLCGNTVTLKNPTRAGYVFKGWYEDENKDGKYNKISQIGQGYYGTVNLVARWEKVTVAKPKITSLYNKSGKKAILKFNGVSKASGYQIVYSTDKKLKKNCKIITTKSKNYTLKKLAKKKTYYVKVRAYRIDSTGKKIYGRYTGVRKVKINK